MVSQCIGSEHGDTIDTLKKRVFSQTYVIMHLNYLGQSKSTEPGTSYPQATI